MTIDVTAGSAGPETANGRPALSNRRWSGAAILAFFILAFVWSWGIAFAALQAKPQLAALSAVLMVASGFGPSVAAVAVVASVGSGQGLRDWLARCLEWRMGWRWFTLAFLVPPAVMLCALAIHALSGGVMPALPAVERLPMFIANFGLVLLFGGPLGEEFGWRGYAMPALAARMNWRAASLIIGLVWGFWHLPLFFMAGTAQSQMPILVFMLNILAGSVLFGWLWQQTGGSILPAIVLHTSLNAWAGLLIVVPSHATGQPFGIVTGLLTVIAIALLIAPDRIAAKARVPC
jgi:uncharacterized protein